MDTRYILQVSDLHFGEKAETLTIEYLFYSRTREPDRKYKDLLSRCIRELDLKFDFAIVAGDVTCQNREDGFEEFNDFIDSLEECLPSDKKRIVVVPGNHDTARGIQHPACHKTFNTAFESYTTPFLGATKKERLPDEWWNKSVTIGKIEESSSGLLGVTGVGKTPYIQKIPRSPFIYDADLKIHIHAFDSSRRIGEHLEPDSGHVVLLNHDNLKTLLEEVKKGESEELEKLRTMSFMADVPEVSEEQLGIMDSVCRALGKNRDASQIFRMAVLHHHVGDIPATNVEISPYDRLVNAREFKTRLLHREFSTIAHGHRHFDFYSYDTSFLTPDQADSSHIGDRKNAPGLWVVSAGTIASSPADGGKRSVVVYRLTMGNDGVSKVEVGNVALEVPPRKSIQFRTIWVSKEDIPTVFVREFSEILEANLRTTALKEVEKELEASPLRRFDQAFRWTFARDVIESVLRQVEHVDLGSLLYQIQTVEKVVTFDEDGNYEAVTTYYELRDRLGVSGTVPIKVSNGTHKQIDVGIQYKVGQKWKKLENIDQVSTGTTQVAYAKVPPEKSGSVTYRLIKKDSFLLSHQAIQEKYEEQRVSQPLTWDRNYNAYESTKHCEDISLVVKIPVKLCQGYSDEDVWLCAWQSSLDITHAKRIKTDEELSSLGVGDRPATFSLDVKTTKKYLEFKLKMEGAVPLAFHYAIVWKPPLP